MAKMIFDEDYDLDEPCLSCDRAYIEDIWNEWCCDEKECIYKVKSEDLHKAETDDKGIKEIQVNTTLYVTNDGEKFNTLKSAQEHEKHLEALEKLNSFKIDGPNYTPFDAYGCPAYDWQWYKVNDLDELYHILSLSAEVYAMENCSDDDDFNYIESRFYNNMKMSYYCSYSGMNSEHRRKSFPKYIAISFEREGFNTLDNIERKHDYEMEKWEKFYQAFKNDLKKDMESDDYYRGAQEEC